MSTEAFAGPVVLAGHFDPATIARMMPPEAARQIAAMRSSPAVPIHSLAQALIARGIQTTVLGGVRGSERIYIQSDPLSVAIYPKRGGWPFVLNGLRRERDALLAFLGTIQPSIVHAHWTFEAGRAVGDWQGPKVLTVHDAAWEYARLGRAAKPIGMAYTARWLKNTGETLKQYRHIIAVSPFVETYLRLKHRFRGEIRVIPNMMPPIRTDLAASASFPKSGRTTFGCYGEPGGIKNVGVAVTAFHQVAESLPGSRLLVFGAGWETAKKQYQAPRIEFRGALPHLEFLRCLVEEVDVWVHPARIEAHPISICEAVQAGCPVIAGGASGGVAWTLDYGQSGILVDIEDPRAVGQAMRQAVLDWPASQAKVLNGQRFIREELDRDRILDLHLAYYNDVSREYSRSSQKTGRPSLATRV